MNLRYFLVVFSLLAVSGACGQESQRFGRDIAGAESAILGSLIVHRNAQSKYLCVENPYACVGPDRAELGLALLSASRHMEAPRKLVELVRFKFDAGLSTDYQCYLHARKDEVSRHLMKASPESLSRQCVDEVARFLARSKAGLYEVSASAICRPPVEIRKALESASEAIRGPSCDGF